MNTALTSYFFGPKLDQRLTVERFLEFQRQLQKEILWLEVGSTYLYCVFILWWLFTVALTWYSFENFPVSAHGARKRPHNGTRFCTYIAAVCWIEPNQAHQNDEACETSVHC